MASYEEAVALLGIKPPTKKMMVVTRSGNTIVRDFPADKVPGRWLREGVELKEGDVVPGTTPPAQATGRILRDATAGTMTEAANYAPMAIPGAGLAPAAARIGTGFVLGAGADAGARALRGQEQSFSGSMMAGGMNAAGQTVGEVIPPLVRSQARPLAKGALGNAVPGMEDRLLAARTPVSNDGMAQDDAFIKTQLDKAKAAIDSHAGQFSSAQIRRALRAKRGAAAKNDLLSNAHQNALDDALSVLQSKVGGGTKTTQSSLVGANGQPLPPTVQRVPTKRLSARELDDINRYAEGEAKKLYEARAENRSSTPSHLESAYKELAEVTNTMLNKIPDVKKANLLVHDRIGLRDAKFDASKRSTGKLVPLLAGLEAGRTAMGMSHNPALATGLGLGTAGAAYAASSPSGMSKMAFAANSPELYRILTAAPRVASAAIQDVTRRRQ